jgi:hypothetical protein
VIEREKTMRRFIFVGLLLSASQAFGQSADEGSVQQMLCTPFVSYAKNLLQFLDTATEVAYSAETNETMRKEASATVECSESGIRLWSHRKADAEFAAAKQRFETGNATSYELGAARVGVAKATYCEAAFSNAIAVAEQFERRKQVGLVSGAAVAPILKSIDALIPLCGWSA